MEDRRINILKIRIATLIDEHADALAQAQQLHQELQESKKIISRLEQQLRNKDVQKEQKATIIEHSVESSEE